MQLIAVPLNHKTMTSTKKLKLKNFNRHYGGYFDHYEIDVEKDYAKETLKYMQEHPGAHTILIDGEPIPSSDVTMLQPPIPSRISLTTSASQPLQ